MFKKFKKFKKLIMPTYKNGWKSEFPEDGAMCAVILVESNVVVADVVFHKDIGMFEGEVEFYAEHEVLKFYQYED